MQSGPALRILGSRVDLVDMDEAAQRAGSLLEARRFAHIVTFGSEMAVRAARDPSYRAVINEADLVVPDTIGIVYASRALGKPLPERVAGIDLVERLAAYCAGANVPIYLLGAREDVVRDAAATLQSRFPGLTIAGTQHGYFGDEAAVVRNVQASGARLLLVALGFPKQEFWIRKHAAELGAIVCMGVGGSFDVLAGHSKRAPLFMRRTGLEWLYRLATEPRRFGRQLALPQFALGVARQAFHERVLRKA